ncbi:MAG: cell division protein ZapA [bacterium]
MSPKKDTQVIIGGKVYTLSGDESEEYIQKVALYINNKLSELKQSENAKKLNTHLMGIFLALNVADDYFKAKNEIKDLKSFIEEKNKTIISLEQDIIGEQVKLENAEVQAEKLKEEIIRLEREVMKYQAELNEYIEAFDHE